ncbi:MAG: P-loop NTPase fold protein, partial [Desulfobacterales bacterium]|nr:P-loop NTPase fold protein [Desulfobacterales bacterium]
MSDPKLKQQDFQNFYALAAVILFVLATVLAFLQPAGTHLRKSEESFWTRFFFPNERNIFLRIHNAATPHARIFGLADARRLWMVTGKYGFSSIDYGKNWVPDNLPSRKHWFNLENTGNWSAISDRGQRYTSQDDGRSWRPDKIPGSFPDLEAETKKAQKVGFNVGSIAFSGNGKYGVAIGGDGYFVQESRDTGLTWQLVAGAPNPLRDRNEYRQWLGAAALTHDGNSGIAVGTHGVFKILRTTPIGPWRPHTSKTGKQPVWSFNHSGETRDKLTDVALSEDGRFGIAVGVQSTILRSTDQGSSWKRIEPPWSWSETWPQGVTLRSVAMSRDGKTVLVAGGNLKGKGVVARSNDSGETWQPIGGTLSGTEIRSIKLAADGLTGFAVGGTPNTLRRKGNGTAGRIFVTRNGGETWSESRPDPAEGDPWPLLTSLFASADARVAIATTADGRLLISNDEGNRWSFSAGYSRTPAYWYYVAVVVSILLILHAVRPLVDPHASDLADHYESDAPVAKASADKLNFTPIAEAISHYLRNPNTTPPLNLAITAPWGTGKSSLMNLLAADLNRHEYRTVWFNAWHHQSEEHLLASLLEAIRVKAVPAWWEPDWLLFTGRLLWIRLTRDLKSPRILFWLMPVLIVMGVYLLGGQVGNIDAEAVNSLTILTAVPVLGLWIGKQARALSIDPAKLAAGIDRRISVKQFREHLGFRHKFNQEFSDVTSALKPSTIVIIIDDLDRCRPENLLEVLEAINFLMHSGRCFVVFGMDANPVLASLEISFEAVAKILAEHEDSGI